MALLTLNRRFIVSVKQCVFLIVASTTVIAHADGPEAPPLPEDAAETYLLRYHFKPGQFVHYEVEASSTDNLAARDHRQTMRRSKQSRKHYRVVSVDSDGSAVLEPVIDYVRMEAQSDNDEPVIFDSSTKSVPRAFEAVAQSVGRVSLRIRYEPTGKVEEVLPVDQKASTAAKNVDTSTLTFLVAFPEQAMKIGDTWNDDYNTQVNVSLQPGATLMKSVQIRRRYTLHEVKDGVATIHFRTYPLLTERNPQVQMQLVQQSLSGSIEFDLNRGLIREWHSGGVGEVFNAFGPTSSMRSEWNTVERFVTQPGRRKPAGPIGPAGPPIPGTASL
jgi:hypothetical protein